MMTKRKIFSGLVLFWCLSLVGSAQGQAPASTTPPPAAAAPQTPEATKAPITEAQLKAEATDRANGDPAGALTGTSADSAVAYSAKGLTIADVRNQIG